jgi:hypothetical protein
VNLAEKLVMRPIGALVSSARRSGCHIGTTLKPQPMRRFFVTPHEVHRHHQQVRDQLRAFRLEMVLGHPERVVAALILRSSCSGTQSSKAPSVTSVSKSTTRSASPSKWNSKKLAFLKGEPKKPEHGSATALGLLRDRRDGAPQA